MSDWLRQRLGLSTQQLAGTNDSLSRVKTVATFFADAVESVRDSTTAIKAIAESTPWFVEATGAAIGEAVPPVKFAITLLAKLTEESDPHVLGLIACTLAYERSVEEAVGRATAPTIAKQVGARVKADLEALDSSATTQFADFSFGTALTHPFIKHSDAIFERFLEEVGYAENEKRSILNHVHRRFVSNLKTILSNRKLAERFGPFVQLMSLGTEEERAYNAILNHVELQRWLFEEAPVFGKEPFALNDVYIATECGAVLWLDIKPGSQDEHAGPAGAQHENDPFSESCGGRHDLLDTVLAYLANPNFNDAVVIQGAAGSGKSSFTLKLCAVLEKEGLYPIRIRLRDLPLDRHIKEGIAKAMFPPDHKLPEHSRGQSVDDPFLSGAAFDESTTFRGTLICPYVLIFDGWDEISISASEGFKVRIAKMLEQVRLQFLEKSGIRVRVILTGRPSTAVSESLFLRERTPILTIRPIRPDQLVAFVSALRLALQRRRIPIESGTADAWTVPPDEEFASVFARYRADYDVSIGAAASDERVRRATASLSVLGLPLLAHLAIRLIAQYEGDRLKLVANPTTLYRSMVDLTCEKGGKPIEEEIEIEGRERVTGTKLRSLLQRTAAAMTAYGEESISFEELALRLNLDETELDKEATELSEHHMLTSLMISFFFKGGQLHLGCEFLHKSFREYLFAEGIVEALKQFGRTTRDSITQRVEYWKDFDDGTPEHAFSRTLSELLSGQWLSPEVISHLEELLPWDISRSFDTASMPRHRLTAAGTHPLLPAQWLTVRDGLADIWHWWGEGAHVRPQPVSDKRTRAVTFDRAYAEELVELDAPRVRSQRHKRIHPSRTVTMDAHLGDGLFRLCAIVHYQIALAEGWLAQAAGEHQGVPQRLWTGASAVGEGPRKCQTNVTQGASRWTLFAPSGDDPRYFGHYIMRIGAAGWRPSGVFPEGVDARGVDLRGSPIAAPYMGGGWTQTPTKWVHSNLAGSIGSLSFLMEHDFTQTYAEAAHFEGAFLAYASFRGACLKSARLSYSFGNSITFADSDLSGAFATAVFWARADLRGVDSSGLQFDGANLEEAVGTESMENSGEFYLRPRPCWYRMSQ